LICTVLHIARTHLADFSISIDWQSLLATTDDLLITTGCLTTQATMIMWHMHRLLTAEPLSPEKVPMDTVTVTRSSLLHPRQLAVKANQAANCKHNGCLNKQNKH
jgi:hypothetical protein